MRKAFTIVELMVVGVIVAILVSVVIQGLERGKSLKRRDAPQGPVDAPSAPSRPVPNSYTFHVADGVLAAEISQILSNGGFEVTWLDERTVAVLRR